MIILCLETRMISIFYNEKRAVLSFFSLYLCFTLYYRAKSIRRSRPLDSSVAKPLVDDKEIGVRTLESYEQDSVHESVVETD